MLRFATRVGHGLPRSWVRRPLWLGTLLLLVLGSAGTGAAAESPPADAPGQRPKIGLVLSGGGARGAAHVGVLKVLQELRIPVDYVAGTSMGAVVGGLYAAGMSAEELERAILDLDWDVTFADLPNRPLRPFRRKEDDRLYLIRFKPGFRDGRLELPIAAIQGQNFDMVLNRLTLGVAEVADFDRLAIPFRAVATDIETGETVVLDHGSLARAMRASLAVPGAFAPVELDGRLLVDGGVSNNLPIDVARQMGAEVLIVVNLSTGPAEREELQAVQGILNQVTTLLTYRDTAQQLKTLGPRDVLISPDLGDISSTNFDRVGETIPPGVAAAWAQAHQLRALSLPPAEYARYRGRHRQVPAPPPVIHFIRIDNRSGLADAMIAARLRQRTGQPLDLAQLEQDLSRLYGLDVFASVRYEIVRDGDRVGLLVRVAEKPWGPNILQFGLRLAADLEGESTFDAGFAYTLTQINRLNGEVRLAGQIGESPGGLLEAYQPLDAASRYFVYGQLRGRQRMVSVYSNGDLSEEFLTREGGAEAGGGRNLGQWGELRLGYVREQGRAEVRVSEPGTPDYSFGRGELRARLSVDTFDQVEFPHRGSYAGLEWIASRTALGADADFDQVLLRADQAYTRGRNTLLGSAIFQTTLKDDAPVQSLFTAGGLTQLSGLAQDELAGQHFGLARAMYYRQYGKRYYLGGSLELGKVWQDSSDIDLDDVILAGSVFTGAATPIGPAYLGYGHAEGGRRRVYLFLGIPF